MKDELFIRGKVPMTKREVRAISLEKLELLPESVCYDIGAGTGSVSIEMAFRAFRGHIYAVEKKEEACALTKQNQQKFGITNMTVISGTAPEALTGLPAPTHVFIGGTSGELKGILDFIREKNPLVRIVINVIALESLVSVIMYLKDTGIEADIISVQISKADHAGGYHLMKGQNPVTVISFGGKEEADGTADS